MLLIHNIVNVEKVQNATGEAVCDGWFNVYFSGAKVPLCTPDAA